MIYFGSSNKISEGDFYEAKETRVKGLETSLPVRARAVAMSHTEISNHAGACNYLFLGLVKIKQTKILTDTLTVILGTVVLVSTEHYQIIPTDCVENTA